MGVRAAQGFQHRAEQCLKIDRDERVRDLRGSPNDLHEYFYERDEFLDATVIAADIESVAELVDLLAPLTE